MGGEDTTRKVKLEVGAEGGSSREYIGCWESKMEIPV